MRLIDADAFDKRLVRLGALSIKSALDEAPTIDAVPVVRCKDCKHSDKIRKWNGVEYLGCCRNYCDIHEVYSNHFCSYGERRNNNAAD